LVAQRLARSRGHDHEHVAAGERRLAGLALTPAEGRETEVLTEGGVEIHGAGHRSAGRGGTRCDRGFVCSLTHPRARAAQTSCWSPVHDQGEGRMFGLELAGGAWIFLAVILIWTLSIIYSLYTRGGSGINQRPHANAYT